MSSGSGGPIEKRGHQVGSYFIYHQEGNHRDETLAILATDDERIGVTVNNSGYVEVWCGRTSREYLQRRAVTFPIFCLESISVSIHESQTELKVWIRDSKQSLHQETFIFDRLVSPVVNFLEMPKDSYTRRKA